MTIKVLYISYDGMTDPLGQSQVLPYLEGLSNKGFDIHLISCEKPIKYNERKEYISLLLKKANIKWHPVKYSSRPPVLSTLWDLYQIKKLSKHLHDKHRFDIIHCRSYISALIGEEFKKKYNTKFLFDMRGFWPDERVDGKLWNLKNPLFRNIYNYFKKKEKDFIKNADGIITLTNSAKTFIKDNFNNNNIINVIPCATNLNFFIPQSNEIKKNIRIQLGINENYVLTYIGSIGTWYMLDEMLDFFVEFKKDKANAIFLFITGDPPNLISKKALLRGISPSDIIIKKANREEVPTMLSASDSAIFFITPTFSKSASSPTKHGELLGCEIPVICNVIGDLKTILEYANTGVLVESFEPESYRKGIKKLLNSTYKSEDFKKTAVDFYSLEKGIEIYKDTYEKICL